MGRHTSRALTAFAIATALTTLAGTAAAQQSQLSVEGRLGTTVPVGELADAGAESGFSVGGDVIYTFQRNLSLYGGFGWDGFNDDRTGSDISASGFDVGLKFVVPQAGKALPWARGGLLLYKSEVGTVDSDRTLGFEGAVGVDLQVGDRLSLVPAARFRKFEPDFDPGLGNVLLDRMDMSYFMIDLAAHLHVG